MHVLSNAHLRVTVIDPAEDQERLGTRFCWGGYIWQVEDRQRGPLLSGPEGLVERPDPFNGHGLPESFRDRTRDGRELTWWNGRGLAPGVGILARDARQQVVLVERCPWVCRAYSDRLEFQTEHEDGDRGYLLTRMIQLVERDVISTTRFSNLGRRTLDLQWFAHPFFQLGGDGAIDVRLPPGVTLPENPGFQLHDQRLQGKRRFVGKEDGHFEVLNWPPGQPLEVSVHHPVLRHVRFTTTFVPSECPIWANGHTFSIEPYQALHVDPVQTRHWALRYTFAARNDTSAPL